MAFGSGNNTMSWVCLHLLLVLVFSAKVVLCGTRVKSIPGFAGDLPFKLYTGYVSVGKAEMFYYFIESEGNPKEDPLLLWYSGGPGCSVLSGIVYENGPIVFNYTAYEGGLPSTYYYPYSWTKTASVLFVDAPVGTGFSYATSADEFPSSDLKTAAQVYGFLREWLEEHPQFLKVQLFIGADSYSGLTGTIVVKYIIDDNDAGVLPRLNLKGYVLGCPLTDQTLNGNSKYVYSHRMGLISDELYEAAKESCNSSFYDATTSEPECYEDVQLMAKQIKDINKLCILEPKCTWASPHQDGETARRYLHENPEEFIRSLPEDPDYYCRNFNYMLAYVWANDEGVRKALNVREGTVLDWKRCNKSLLYTEDVESVVEYHKYLSTKGLQVLIFNGDHDLTVPNTGTEQWIRSLDLPVVQYWRPWLVDGQIAGYTVKYSSSEGYRLTYATVKGAGHSAPEYKRRECYMMFDRFIHYYPL
ncbi:putative peptidase S10, serine carboxypeptidase, alpha/Beta hydrolase [Rosa chinensis]|uniref:Putative peptidase S10, serine carboxypeptidase, alpha/Beta hydrolase n=1 Tax=Rosa chinensis TaxID=74649 RepID=A0A2P6PK81_ROSCH|nr:serine carboxypeptidase-like 17 [Rosa chinensis]XP_024168215.1 serine carboxypeptidase-like 17 [Rosa chinensis]PRQ22320.1 putative peptidase S10, serine carboxypeptidase, alpha/Beta hydrolase [Rosa chinensis]